MGRFEIGDQAMVTTQIRRRDGQSTVAPCDIVSIIGVYDTSTGNQIVDIQPNGDRPKMIDIVIFRDSDTPLRRI